MSTVTQDDMTVTQVAEYLGLTTGRVRQMLRDGDLSGDKLDEWMWIVNRRSVEKAAKKPQVTGRPRSGKRA
jgi:hypothetical protein